MIACKRMKEGEKDSYFYTEGSEFDLATRGEMHISILFCPPPFCTMHACIGWFFSHSLLIYFLSIYHYLICNASNIQMISKK